MIPDVIPARYIDNYIIEVSFDDGIKGIVDFSKYLKMGGVFERFNNVALVLSNIHPAQVALNIDVCALV